MIEAHAMSCGVNKLKNDPIIFHISSRGASHRCTARHSPELDVGRVDPRVGSGRVGSGPHFLEISRVGSGPEFSGSGRVRESVGRVTES